MKINSVSELKVKLLSKQLTEHSYENVELKRDWIKDYGEKISMLCNGQPGQDCFLVIGVEDDGTLSGHDDRWLSTKIEVISQHCNQYLDPAISLEDITSEDIDGNKVVICHAKNPGVVVKWIGTAYSGKGTTKKKLTPDEIMELNLSLPGMTDLSKKPAEYTANADLVNEFCEMAGLPIDKNILSRLHLDNTKCGDILFGKAKFRVVEYDSTGDVVKNETRVGLINLLSEKIYDEIRNYYSKTLKDSKRISNSLLREAIGNCVGHAAYKENDGEIIIELHPNRAIFSNLAYAEYTSLANKWFSSAHKSPNSFLMETLRIANRVDELGRGKKKLLSECLIHGFYPPTITVSDAGQYKRWALQIDFKESDRRYKNLMSSINNLYKGAQEKSLIAYALVLWSEKPFSEIKRYFDSHESKIAAEIIGDFNGPVYFWDERDSLVLRRWTKILVEEGKASKEFTYNEEKQIYNRCLELHNKHYGGVIKPAEFRKLAHLSTSQSDKSLTLRTFKKWEADGKVKRIKHGTYKFTDTSKVEIEKDMLVTLLKAFENK